MGHSYSAPHFLLLPGHCKNKSVKITRFLIEYIPALRIRYEHEDFFMVPPNMKGFKNELNAISNHELLLAFFKYCMHVFITAPCKILHFISICLVATK